MFWRQSIYPDEYTLLTAPQGAPSMGLREFTSGVISWVMYGAGRLLLLRC